ncbi:hypothetical protein CYD94_19765 (plasmid) [Ralstonia solanacearum]|nr:hypothetical protein CYD94_19765 [Ralstonia solanacearum]
MQASDVRGSGTMIRGIDRRHVGDARNRRASSSPRVVVGRPLAADVRCAGGVGLRDGEAAVGSR